MEFATSVTVGSTPCGGARGPAPASRPPGWAPPNGPAGVGNVRVPEFLYPNILVCHTGPILAWDGMGNEDEGMGADWRDGWRAG